MESWSITVHKDYLKFSCAHFLIYSDGTPERLHGHNYKVYVEVGSELDDCGLVINFNQVKPLIRALVDELDEHMLVPGEHAVLRTKTLPDGRTEVRYLDKVYAIPTGDIIVLPINNTSAENLASWIAHELLARIGRAFPGVAVHQLTVGVEETPGQRGVCKIDCTR